MYAEDFCVRVFSLHKGEVKGTVRVHLLPRQILNAVFISLFLFGSLIRWICYSHTHEGSHRVQYVDFWKENLLNLKKCTLEKEENCKWMVLLNKDE